MNFVLDIGNTNVKAAVFQADGLIDSKIVSLGDLGNVIDEFLKKHNPSHLIASSVSATMEELTELIDNRIPWLFFTNEVELPISVEYQSKKTLGSDRLAGIMAVYNEYPKKNVLVIDAGTCITYDLLTFDNRYFGGSISPGLAMRYKSIHQFTKNLPDLDPISQPSLIGQTTEESIHSGIINGINFEIDGVINAYRKRFGNLIIITTGGDSKNFVKELKNTIFADQNLILKGLNKILSHHYQNA